MESFHRPTRVEIDLDALGNNIRQFRKALPTSIQLMAVVKANGYGHGAIQVANEALSQGIQYLGVNFLDEALELRLAGIHAPILVLGYTPPEALVEAWRYHVAVSVFSQEMFPVIETIGTAEQPLTVHVKVDTGMGRLGIVDEEEAVQFVLRLSRLSNVKVEGIFSHYAAADETNKSFTRIQYERFLSILNRLKQQGVYPPLRHAGNSATAIDLPDWSENMIRLGVSLYGLYPSNDVDVARVDLKPVMQFKTGIVHLKTVPANTPISYGCTYVTQTTSKVATIPVGYGDGYTRLLTGKVDVLVRGKRVPVIGRICMDQCMIDVTQIEDVALGDEVILFGEQVHPTDVTLCDAIRAEELASLLGTINYEITCMVSHRVPRVFLRNGQTENVVNLLFHTEGKSLADYVWTKQ